MTGGAAGRHSLARRIQAWLLGRRLVRPLVARPRLLASLLSGLVIWALAPAAWPPETRALIGWNGGVLLYLLLAGLMMLRDDHEALTRRAVTQDEGRFAILALAVLATGASVVAIVMELGNAKQAQGYAKALPLSLAVVTILTAWFFIHLMFALHYAHDFARERRLQDHAGDGSAHQPHVGGGLEFPGTKTPDYADFLYFSYVIGVACQTADVEISSPSLRQTALVHGIVAFFFNTTILALTINIAAGLI